MSDRDSQIEVIARGVWLEHGHLLLCRNRERRHLFLPGGHVEFNEPAREALERELREEAGLSLKAGGFLGVFEAGFDQVGKHGPRRHHELNLLFLIQPARAGRSIRGQRKTPPSRLATSSCMIETALPVVTSLESHIEFVWHPMGLPRSAPAKRSRTGILPNGIEDFLRRILGPNSAVNVRELHRAWESVWMRTAPSRKKK